MNAPPAARNALKGLMPRRGISDSHPGLLLQRYLQSWAAGDQGDSEEKLAILQAAISAAGNPEVRELYKIAFGRWQTSLPELTAANDLQTVGRLIVGLGTENVLETGIRLHHTYGMPILPGSALKGLASHYCDQVWGERDKPTPSEYAMRFRGPRKEDRENSRPAEAQGQYHELLFGATDDGGCIVFHDGWFVPDADPEKNGPLKLDVMAPHHKNWNNLENPEPPTDFDSPVPLPFLSVAGKFHVAVSWYGPEDYEKSIAWTGMAFELALAGLTDWGIGGKTTSSYGRMTEPEPGKRKKPFSASALGLPAVGSIAQATLLDAPKKDKSWRAKVQLRGGKELSGPIEGSPAAPPKSGQIVRLVVIEIGENKIRYQWPQPAKK